MDDTRSTSTLSRSPQSKAKREEVIDKTLESISNILNVLNEFKGFIPVSAVGNVVPVLKLIVEQIRNARTNSKTALEIVEQIEDLVQMLDETVKEVRTKIEEMNKLMGNDSRYRLEREQFNKPGQFNTIIRDLQRKLEPLPDEIRRIQKRDVFSRVWFNSEVKQQLEKVKGDLTNAVDNFRIKQSVIATATLQHVQSMVNSIYQAMANKENEDALRALPHVDAGYDVNGGFGYIKGTRIGLISDIRLWYESPNAAKFLLLFGGAGTGKSTIAWEICQQLQCKSMLGASYFFVRSDAGAVGSVQYVISTIAFQLAALQPRFGQYIANAAREFTKLFSGSLEKQTKSLIIKPMKDAQSDYPDVAVNSTVIVLDALDEASGDLAGLLESLKTLTDEVPWLRILITTRPDSPVRYALDTADISNAIRVEMEELDRVEVAADIRRFLETRFNKLRWRDRLHAAHPNAIELLASRADGLFIFVHTVMNDLVTDVPEVSESRLASFLANDDSIGLSALDKVYSSVLDNAYSADFMTNVRVNQRVVAVLGGLVVLQEQVSVEVMGPLMGVEVEEVERTVGELRSIISLAAIGRRKDIIRPLHLTLREFLVDEERCTNKSFYVDRRVHHLRAARSCLRIMNKELRRDMCRLGDGFKDEIEDLESRVQEHIPSHVQYACMYWSVHIVENDLSADSELQELLEEFCKNKLLQWVEALSVMNRLDLAVQVLLRVRPWVKADSGTMTVLEDVYRLVVRFFEPINESPRQIYTSALWFAPRCSLVGLYGDPGGSNCMVTPQDPLWGTCLSAVECDDDPAQFSRDGRYILSLTPLRSIASEIAVRDATTGNTLKTVRREEKVISADIHPNNCSVVSLLNDGTVDEWDWTSGVQSSRVYACAEEDRNKRTWNGQVAYNDDGSRIVCYWNDVDISFISVWSTGDQTRPMQRISLPSGSSCRAFSLDSDGTSMAALLTSVNDCVVVKRWNIETGDELSSLRMGVDKVKEAMFAKNNKILVTGHDWDDRELLGRFGKRICVFKLEDDSWSLSATINTLWTAFGVSRSGSLIACGFKDIRIWNTELGEKLAVYQGHNPRLWSLRFSSQEDRLVSTDGLTLRILDTSQAALSLASFDNGNLFYSLTYAPSGEYIAVGVFGHETRIYLFDGKNGSHLATFTKRMRYADPLSFSAGGSLLASCHGVKGVFLWDVERRKAQPRKLAEFHPLGLGSYLVFNATQDKLAVVSTWPYSFKVRIWDISDWPDGNETELGSLILQSKDIQGDTPHYLRFSPTDPLSFIRKLYKDEKVVMVWECASDTMAKFAYDENVHSAVQPAFKERGNWIVSTRTGRRLLWLPNDRIVHNRAFEVNGDMVAIGSTTGKFTLLDMSRLSDSA